MKKGLIFVSLVISVLVFTISNVCEAKEIAQWYFNQDIYDGYAVDDSNKGEIISYQNSYSNNLLERVTWVYERLDKETWTGSLLVADFPSDTADAEIVGLRRKNVLILFTDTNGNRTYARYKVRKNSLHNPKLHIAQTNETCRFAKNKILSTINVDGKMTLQEYSMQFKEKKNRKVDGLGIVTEINAPFGKYYVDQSGTVGVGNLLIRIIKPGGSNN